MPRPQFRRGSQAKLGGAGQPGSDGLALALVAPLVVVAALAAAGGDDTPTQQGQTLRRAGSDRPRRTPATDHRVRAGGPARAWSDYTIAGRKAGPQVIEASQIMVSCRTDGFVVDDGNRWWYLIAFRPWNKRFWVVKAV